MAGIEDDEPASNPAEQLRQPTIGPADCDVGWLDLAYDAISVRDAEGRIRYWNHGAETLYGWSKDQAVGSMMHELLRTIYPVALEEIVAEMRRTGKWEGELHNITRNGSTVIVASRWNVFEVGGIQTDIVEIDRDITAQKRIEEGFHGLNRALESLVTDLRRAKEMFYGLLESAPEPVVICREDGEIILVNDQTEEQFGYTREELLGQPIELLVPHSLRKRHVVHREQYLRHPTVRPLGVGHELFGLRKNGEQFPVDISLSPLTTDEGVFITSSIRDISERKGIENDLRKKNLELEREILELKRAAAMISPQLPGSA